MAKVAVPRLLVVGGTGFIGHHLLRTGMKKGWNLTSISLNPPISSRQIEGVRYLNLDLTSIVESQKLLCEREYEYVVNLAGYIDHIQFRVGGRKLIEAHFVAVQNLLDSLPFTSLVRFIQIGSSDEYGDAPSPQQENFRENPISPYSLAKVASTHFIQMLQRTEQFPGVILRLFLVYGPGQGKERFLPQIIHGCLNGESFPSSGGHQLRDFCYIEDIVNGIICSLETPNIEGEIINIASGNPVAIRQVIEQVTGLIGDGRPMYGSIPYRESESMSLIASVDKSRELLNWRPKVSLQDGLVRTVDWYRKFYD